MWLPEPAEEVATAAGRPHRQGSFAIAVSEKSGACEKLGVSVPGSDQTSELFLPSIPRPASLVVADFAVGTAAWLQVSGTVYTADLASLGPPGHCV